MTGLKQGVVERGWLRRVAAWAVAGVISFALLAGGGSAAWGQGGAGAVDFRLPPRVSLEAGGEASIELVATISSGFYVTAHGVSDAAGVELRVELIDDVDDERLSLMVDYPEGERLGLQDDKRVYSGVVRLPAVLAAEAGAAVGERQVTVKLHYQGCTEAICFAPSEVTSTMTVEVLPAGGGSSAVVGVGGGEEAGGAGVSGAAEDGPIASGDERMLEATNADDETAALVARLQSALDEGAIVLVGLFIVLGIGLNLTPCVFPLVPMTAGFFASQGHSRISRTLPLAAVYVLGICLTFSGLGVLVAVFGGQFGAFVGSPWGVGIITVILLLMAVSLLGGFEISLPLGFISRLQGKSGFAGALVMGAAVGLVATPCVGPVLAAVVLFVTGIISELAASGAGRGVQIAVGGGLFFALGFGLGLPQLLLGLFSGQVKRIPRGGGWLLWVKRLLALPVLAMALYFLQPYLGRSLFMGLLALLLGLGGLYLGLLEGLGGYPWSRRFLVLRVVMAMLLASAATAIVVREILPDDRPATLTWEEFSAETLAAAGAEGRPAVVYFTADWCHYCRVMEGGLFRTRQVHEALAGFSLLKADLTRGLPEGHAAGELMKSAGSPGPPTMLFFDVSGKRVDRIIGEPSVERLLRAAERAEKTATEKNNPPAVPGAS